MASDDRIQFGSVLDREESSKKVWLVIIPVLLLVGAGIVWAVGAGSRADAAQRQVAARDAQIGELQQAVEQRDKLLVEARANEALLQTAGQATALFFGVSPRSTESGVAVALPGERAARVVLYGLVQPPQGEEYVLAARTGDGAAQPLVGIIPSEAGTAFALVKDLPEGTRAIELLHRPTGQEDLSGATPRVSARYPATPEERGILTEPVAQARRGR